MTEATETEICRISVIQCGIEKTRAEFDDVLVYGQERLLWKVPIDSQCCGTAENPPMDFVIGKKLCVLHKTS